jgi:DNA-binding NarL/FixJ family response regulator
MGSIRVVMADDHEIFRDGFKLMLSRNKDIELIAEAENGRDLVELVGTHSPDVVVTDIKMPIMDGIEATRVIKSKHPQIGIIGLSMFDEDDLIIEMLDAGALGYLLKNADKDEVAAAIQAVFRGDHYYCRSTHAKMMQLIAKSRYNPYLKKEKITFTDKEIEVIQLICQEYTNKEIADKINVSVRTIEGYRLRIQERMQVKNTVGLVVYAIKHGIFDPKIPGN